MIAMQYSFKLPASYDMNIIWRRISDKGPSFDGLPGLIFKSFLMNERGKGWPPATVNEYAPFYLWKSAQVMQDFLLGEQFAAGVEEFGRPIVRTWTVLESYLATEPLQMPAFALRETFVVPESQPLAQAVKAERELQCRILDEPKLFSRILALDPTSWEIVQFSLWRETPPHLVKLNATFQGYQALYLAR